MDFTIYGLFPTTTEAKTAAIKHICIQILERSSWTLESDSGLTLSQKIEWLEYRQAVKELQTTYPNPDDLIFPTPPAGERL